MESIDNRGRRIIFVGSCILNQNVRAPGVAIQSGTFSDFVQILLRSGIRRGGLYKWQPLVFLSLGKWWSPILQFLIRTTTFVTHGLACKREAKRAVAWIEDHLKQGFEVTDVVTANDSPMCGVTNTLDLIDLMRRVKFSGMTLDDFENPRLEKLGPFMHSALIDGAGAFAGSIKKERSRRHLEIKMTGWNPWDNSEAEAARIGRLPDLKV